MFLERGDALRQEVMQHYHQCQAFLIQELDPRQHGVISSLYVWDILPIRAARHWRRGRHHQSVVGVYLHDHPVLPPVVPLAGAEGDNVHRWTLGPVLEVVAAEGPGYSRKSTSHGSIGTGAPTAACTRTLSYPVFMPKLSTHRMHDPGSNVPHIRPKVLTDNQMS
jgi:hypothetical protein